MFGRRIIYMKSLAMNFPTQPYDFKEDILPSGAMCKSTLKPFYPKMPAGINRCPYIHRDRRSYTCDFRECDGQDDMELGCGNSYIQGHGQWEIFACCAVYLFWTKYHISIGIIIIIDVDNITPLTAHRRPTRVRIAAHTAVSR